MILSIITVNYNNSHGLEQTIESVVQQDFADYEYIIVDGGSSDKSVDVIKRYEKKLSFWISEKDNGIYHAMNKGIVKAKGEYLFMLNSGDVLINPSVLSKVFDNNTITEDVLYGNIEWHNQGHFFVNSAYPEILSSTYFWQKSIGHQAAFIKKSIHDIVGLYDEQMKIAADWKFFILAFQKYHLKFRFLPFVIAVGDSNGISWNQANYFIVQKEKEVTIKRYFSSDYKAYKQIQHNNKLGVKNRIIIMKQRFARIFK